MAQRVVCLAAIAAGSTAFQPSIAGLNHFGARGSASPISLLLSKKIDYGAQGYTPSPFQKDENGESGTKTLLRVPWGKDSSFEVPEREGGIGSTGGITISRDAIRDIAAGEFGTKTLLRVPWGKDSSFEVPEREGGIGSTGGITISRDAIRDIAAGEFGTKTLLRVPWGKDSSFEVPEREGGIGSTGGITISRDAIRDIAAGEFGTKTLLRVPWGKDSSFEVPEREGGIGSTGGITISRDAIRDIAAGEFGTKTLLRVPWGKDSSFEVPEREGGIGSTGGITISRDAIRDIAAGEFGTKTLLRVPWGKDSSFEVPEREGGIGSTGGITISRDAIRDIAAGAAGEAHATAEQKTTAPEPPEILVKLPSSSMPMQTSGAYQAPAPPAQPPTRADAKKARQRTPPQSLRSQATAAAAVKPVTLGLAEGALAGKEGAKAIFGFLQSRSFSTDREGFILGDIFADTVVRNGGFSDFAEKVNGRTAQVAFPLAVAHTGDGNLLSQLAAHPLQALLLSGVIALASMPPMLDAKTDDRRAVAVFKAVVPADLRTQLVDAFESSPLKDVFSDEAELTNSRAAMLGLAVFMVTAAFFG